MTLPSVIQCAGHCKLNKECSGFTYNETNGDCVMSCCVNPQQLEEAAGGDDDVIYAETTPNHLLARGIFNYMIISFPIFTLTVSNMSDKKPIAN